MNQYGVMFYTPDSNNTNKVDCGAIYLPKTNLTKQDTYKERHADDEKIKPFFVSLFETFKPSLILAAIILFVFEILIMNGFIPSESMAPTLNVGNGIIVNRLSYVSSSPSRGDVVVFQSEEYGDAYLIKRVVGIPGDIIDIKDGNVYVNGCKLIEEYAVGETLVSLRGESHFEVPEDSVFLLGDNRGFSEDSRFWENPYISFDNIIGKACVQYSFLIQNGLFVKAVDSISPSFVNQ